MEMCFFMEGGLNGLDFVWYSEVDEVVGFGKRVRERVTVLHKKTMMRDMGGYTRRFDDPIGFGQRNNKVHEKR